MLYEYISHCIDCCKSVSLTRSVKKRFPHENSVTIRYCFYSLRQQPKKLIRRLHVRKQNSRTIKLRVVSLDVTRIFSCEPNILEIRSSVQQLKNKQNVRRSLFCCGILKIKHYDDTAIQKRIRGRSKRKIGYIVRERDKRRKGGNGEICAGQVGRITCTFVGNSRGNSLVVGKATSKTETRRAADFVRIRTPIFNRTSPINSCQQLTNQIKNTYIEAGN